MKDIRDVLTIRDKQGFVPHMPVEEYEAVTAIRFSHVKYMEQSPLHFMAAFNGDEEDKEAWMFGRALHVAVFEPRSFASRVWESDGRRTPAKKQEAIDAGAELLKPGMGQYCYGVAALAAERIAALDELRPFVEAGQPELAGFVVEHGMQCKFRLDWLASRPVILDLKSTKDASNRAFSREFYRRRYNVQLGLYQHWAARLLECNPWAIPVHVIVMENHPPCDCFLAPRYAGKPIPIDQAILDRGAKIGLGWIKRIRECIDAGTFPGVAGTGDYPIDTPAWEMDEEEDQQDNVRFSDE